MREEVAKKAMKLTSTTQKTNMSKKTAKKEVKSCEGMDYTPPVIITHTTDPRSNIYVVTNEVHARSTNNGFSRPAGGQFYCH